MQEGFKLTASLVDLGAVLYAVIAVMVERGIAMVFWALEKRKQWREAKMMEEIRAKVREEVRAEAEQEFQERLNRILQERGVAPNELSPR